MKTSVTSAATDHATGTPAPARRKPTAAKVSEAPVDELAPVAPEDAEEIPKMPSLAEADDEAEGLEDVLAEPELLAAEIEAAELAPAIDDEDEVDAAPAAVPVARATGGRMGSHMGGGMQNGRPAPISRASNKDETFAEGDYVVYPTHGVGKVEKIAVEDIAGHRLDLIHITFEENRMTLRVPVTKARSAGLRKLATRKLFDEALAVLKGRARVKRTMWSRRAQEYEAKINSGDPLSIAEVVRDLHRNAGQPDQSFSERQIYEAAIDRLAAELAALDQTDKPTAITKLGTFLKTA